MNRSIHIRATKALPYAAYTAISKCLSSKTWQAEEVKGLLLWDGRSPTPQVLEGTPATPTQGHQAHFHTTLPREASGAGGGGRAGPRCHLGGRQARPSWVSPASPAPALRNSADTPTELLCRQFSSPLNIS